MLSSSCSNLSQLHFLDGDGDGDGDGDRDEWSLSGNVSDCGVGFLGLGFRVLWMEPDWYRF